MHIFSKIDKEIIAVLLALLVIIFFVGFIIYKYIFGPVVLVENSAGGLETSRSYISTDLNVCKYKDFTCSVDLIRFSDETGCGCEKKI